MSGSATAGLDRLRAGMARRREQDERLAALMRPLAAAVGRADLAATPCRWATPQMDAAAWVRRESGGAWLIEVDAAFVASVRPADRRAALDTLLVHELAHLAVGAEHDHDAVWRAEHGAFWTALGWEGLPDDEGAQLLASALGDVVDDSRADDDDAEDPLVTVGRAVGIPDDVLAALSAGDPPAGSGIRARGAFAELGRSLRRLVDVTTADADPRTLAAVEAATVDRLGDFQFALTDQKYNRPQ